MNKSVRLIKFAFFYCTKFIFICSHQDFNEKRILRSILNSIKMNKIKLQNVYITYIIMIYEYLIVSINIILRNKVL